MYMQSHIEYSFCFKDRVCERSDNFYLRWCLLCGLENQTENSIEGNLFTEDEFKLAFWMTHHQDNNLYDTDDLTDVEEISVHMLRY